MNIVTSLSEWQALRKKLATTSIGLVHTMGNLHAGHLSLCARAKAENAISVCVIYVNPTQFNQSQDFERYPRTLDADKEILQQHNVDYLLLFSDDILYPDQYSLRVSETELSQALEGEYRPGHFTGMLTIVLKVLNIVQPTSAYYGEKDFQQLLLIKKMTDALFLPYAIIGCPTIRAEDGVALSSRNTRLSSAQREFARHFPRLLQSNLDASEVKQKLSALGFKVDYIVDKWQRRLGAVWVDDVRLIDNIAIPVIPA